MKPPRLPRICTSASRPPAARSPRSTNSDRASSSAISATMPACCSDRRFPTGAPRARRCSRARVSSTAARSATGVGRNAGRRSVGCAGVRAVAMRAQRPAAARRPSGHDRRGDRHPRHRCRPVRARRLRRLRQPVAAARSMRATLPCAAFRREPDAPRLSRRRRRVVLSRGRARAGRCAHPDRNRRARQRLSDRAGAALDRRDADAGNRRPHRPARLSLRPARTRGRRDQHGALRRARHHARQHGGAEQSVSADADPVAAVRVQGRGAHAPRARRRAGTGNRPRLRTPRPGLPRLLRLGHAPPVQHAPCRDRAARPARPEDSRPAVGHFHAAAARASRPMRRRCRTAKCSPRCRRT